MARPLDLLKVRAVSRNNSSEDSQSLFNERQSSRIPLTKSPFAKPFPNATHNVNERERSYPRELKVNVAEIPWSDLLLEVAMATTFSSLTDGTPVLRPSNVVSYLSFFALVWWTWASQVAYNVRFRQADWMHRLFVFLQLLVFCSLAAFTNNFDITDGIRPDRDEQLVQQWQLVDSTESEVNAANFRDDRLPTLNARGISIAMALSRLLLLLQYAQALYHARKAKCHALWIHIGSLAMSSISYFAAYIVIGKAPAKMDNILKIVLWFTPILLELLCHFLSNTLHGRVAYSPKAIYQRAATVFIIILGGGLDKITNGFQFIVGNVSLGRRSAGLILSGAIIFISQFSLYFGMSENSRPSDNRALAWFFSHFFYLSALIVTLQGVAALLVFGNIGSALHLPIELVHRLGDAMQVNPGVHLNLTDFHSLQRPLFKIGLSLESMLDYVNVGIDNANRANDTTIANNALLQQSVMGVSVILQNFDAAPQTGTLLSEEISAFLQSDPANTTIVNNATFIDIVEGVFYTRGQPALWFYAAAGSTLVFLAMLGFIIRWPRDNFEWTTTSTRLLAGLITISMSVLNIGANDGLLDSDLNYTGSRIWDLALHSWVLPPFAILITVEQIIELVLMILAGRSRQHPTGTTFGRNSAVLRGEDANTFAVSFVGHASNQSADQRDVYDPYRRPSVMLSKSSRGWKEYTLVSNV